MILKFVLSDPILVVFKVFGIFKGNILVNCPEYDFLSDIVKDPANPL